MPEREIREVGRRTDPETRARVDEIAASMHAYRERLDHRYRRVAWLCIGSVFVTGACVLLGFLLLQGQRWVQARDGCERTNGVTEATIGLLQDLKVRGEVVLIAKVRYPHVPPLAHHEGAQTVAGPPPNYEGPMTCSEFADDRVKGPRL